MLQTELAMVPGRPGADLLDPGRLARRLQASSQPRFELVAADSPDRATVETMIRGVYADAFGAQPSQLAPMLLAAWDADRNCLAAAGIRLAAREPLFLEQYLDRPVEQAVASATAVPVARNTIVEIGNLAAARRGHAMLLFVILATSLQRAGHAWLACTATRRVRALLGRLGVTPLDLGAADAERLGEHAASWGDYYAGAPRTLVVALDEALARAPSLACVVEILRAHAEEIDTISATLARAR